MCSVPAESGTTKHVDAAAAANSASPVSSSKIEMGDEEKIRTNNIFWTCLDGANQFEDAIFYRGNCSLYLRDTYRRPHFIYRFYVILRPTFI